MTALPTDTAAAGGFRSLYVGELVQTSFMSLGGTDDPWATVDAPLCRDGANRLTLRGSTLAGALAASLRRVLGQVPKEISGAENGEKTSLWRFFHSHPDNEAAILPDMRQHVAINAQTGAAEDTALFNAETLPPGLVWPFLLEVDTRQSLNPKAADELAEIALAEWQAGRCWLGREVARGMGWLELRQLKCYVLQPDDWAHWPNSAQSHDYPSYIARQFAQRQKVLSHRCSELLTLTGSLSAGPRTIADQEPAYGLDSLSIGGHANDDLNAAWNEDFLAPDGLADPQNHFYPDGGLIMLQPGASSKPLPYIPGSSLRGVLRHALRRLLVARRAAGLFDKDVDAVMTDLFGNIKQSGRLLLKDALPAPDAAFKLAWLQHHAEDEFTAGSYGSAKFDRIAVFQGSFDWQIVLLPARQQEMGSKSETGSKTGSKTESKTDKPTAASETCAEVFEHYLSPLLELARQGQIGLGGGQWHGHGWLTWRIDPVRKPWETRP